MGKTLKMVRDKREDDARDPRRPGGVGCCSGQTKHAITGKRERNQCRHAMDCQSAETKGKKREEQQRDAIVVLGKRHCVFVGEKGGSVKEMQGIMKGLMIIPPDPVC